MKNEVLENLAIETAKAIRKRRCIPGWHEDESKFPECEFSDIIAMLEKAYKLGRSKA